MHRSRRLLSLPFTTLVALFASVFLFGGVAHAEPVYPLTEGNTIVQQQAQELQEKKTALQKQAQESEDLAIKKQALADKLASEQQKIADLKQKIADKKAAEQKAAEEAAKAAEAAKIVVVSAPVIQGGTHYNCGDNYYAAYIYGMESGGRVVGNCDTYAPNSEGCIGIGQACPGSKLRAACPNLDYACENAFFTNYANKYGGWAGAYQFWIAHNWW
jgi:hypothetical protein